MNRLCRCSRPAPRCPARWCATGRRPGCMPCASTATPAASRPRSPVFGRRPTASSTCEPPISGAPSAQSACAMVASPRFEKPMHLAFRRTPILLRGQDILDRRGDIFVFAMHQARPHFENRHLAAKAPEHLPELQADIAAAHNDQVLRQEVHLHHGTVGEIRHLIESGHFRHDRASAHVDKDPVGARAAWVQR